MAATAERSPESEEAERAPSGEHLALRFYDVTSADGTRIKAWTNDAEGPTLLLCNGLGTNPYAWPALLRKDCGVRVVSWNHRGVGGSDRPADRSRVGIDAFIEDALAVLDDAGIESCAVAGWSIGVNTAFELAVLYPHRVTGLFAVAGVPGGTFASMGAPLMIPRIARRPVSVGVTRLMRRVGCALTPFTSRLPVGDAFARLLSHSGFMLPTDEIPAVRRAVKEFLTTPVDWYMHLGVHTARHPRVSLRDIKVPVVLVAATYDILAGARHMATAAERLADATYVELHGTHFIQMEQPERVHQLLRDFLHRVG